jgi:hypothetical protein
MFAYRAWVNGVDDFVGMPWVSGYRLVQNQGRGLIIQGNRDWQDVSVTADISADLAASCGIALRAQGMRRYYALLLHRSGEVRLVKVVGEETVLASCPFEWNFGESYSLNIAARGNELTASVNGEAVLSAKDDTLKGGGMALVIEEGCSTTHKVEVKPSKLMH